MALRDKPRPSIYWPNTPSQWREPTVDDCTWYAVEFGFQAASKDHLSMHPVNDLRNHSSDTIGGTPVPVALREVYRLWPKDQGAEYRYGLFSRTEIRRMLKDGKTIIWGGDYEKLPKHYRRWTYNDTFDHAMASRDFRTNGLGTDVTFLYDPLGGGPQRDFYDGEWISLDALLDFSWGANGKEYVGVVYGTAQPKDNGGDEMIKGNVERQSNKWVEIPKGVWVWDSPDGEVVRETGTARRYDYFGYTKGHWAIGIFVAGDPVIAYVKKNDNWARGQWPEEPVVNPPDVDRQQLLDRIVELDAELAAERQLSADLNTALMDIETIVETTLVTE